MPKFNLVHQLFTRCPVQSCTRANLGFGYSWNSRFVLRKSRSAKPKNSVSWTATGKFYGLHWKIKLSFLNGRTKCLFVKNDDSSKWCIVITDKLTEDAPILDSPTELKPFWASADPTNPKVAWLSDQGNISHINRSNLAPVAPEQSCARLWRSNSLLHHYSWQNKLFC